MKGIFMGDLECVVRFEKFDENTFNWDAIDPYRRQYFEEDPFYICDGDEPAIIHVCDSFMILQPSGNHNQIKFEYILRSGSVLVSMDTLMESWFIGRIPKNQKYAKMMRLMTV